MVLASRTAVPPFARQDDTVTDISKMRPMLVEFVGAAGVGKSYLAARVYDELIRRNVPVANLQLIGVRKGSVRNLWTVVEAAFVTLLLKPKRLAMYMRLARRLAKYKIRQRSYKSGHGVYICDAGIFQMLRALYRNSKSRCMTDIADRLFNYVKIPDVVVVVEATIEKIFARRSDRNRSNDSFSHNSVKRDVLLLEDTIRAIKHAQRVPNAKLHMIVIDAEKDDTKAVVQKTVSFVEARLARVQKIESR